MTNTIASEITRLEDAKMIYARDYDTMMAVIRAQAKQLAEAREALQPFAGFAEDVDHWRHEDDSFCTHRIKASHLREARNALAAINPIQELPA
ncbi:hypothetical protein [Zavarzinella formosa]|uniref:hypothetical protein n=1 Tax=Zavarzinella formosa TaxID=360055 RepID=UPI0002F701EC|nr:hypothetical protein [Zavarzinella formosa]